MDNKVLLIILDGYGEGKKYKGNAVTNAKTPFINKLRKDNPSSLLAASGNAVGLPKGTMGGSEVGHYTIGAGKVVWQSLEEINQSIKDKSFFKKKALLDAIKKAKKSGRKLHLLGMISDQGVHSQYEHLFELLKLCKKEKFTNVYIHAITDGRDVPEKSGDKFLRRIKKELAAIKVGKLATMIGRFYAMDRDTNWKRTQKAYDLYTKGSGVKEKDALAALKKQYKKGIDSDYYIKPVVFDENGLIENKDSVIFFNYRTDRAAQITKAFTEARFKEFKRAKKVIPHFVCFGPYSKIAPVVYPAPKLSVNLGNFLSKKKLPQLRVAETEKYAHVTFFFNSQHKEPYPKENRILIPSPKVASYEDKPEMSALKITTALIRELKKKEYKLVALNFANGDLVGHSGNYKATVKGIETLNDCLEKIVPFAQKKGYTVLITADHGNAEYMIYEKNGEDCPAHSLNPVPLILISPEYKKLKKKGGLRDVAPTIIDIMKLKKPASMEGNSLIIK
jgi:2,3-bisphosphoglycerate-independent phosphoglycerate mutase